MRSLQILLFLSLMVVSLGHSQLASASCFRLLGGGSIDVQEFDAAKSQLEAWVHQKSPLSFDQKTKIWSETSSKEQKLAAIEVFANQALQQSGEEENPQYSLNEENLSRISKIAARLENQEEVTRGDILELLNAYEVDQRFRLLQPSSWKLWYQAQRETAQDVVEHQWKMHLATKGVLSELPDIADTVKPGSVKLLRIIFKVASRVLLPRPPQIGRLKDKEISESLDRISERVLKYGVESGYYQFQSEFTNKAARSIGFKRFQSAMNTFTTVVFVGTILHQVHTDIVPLDSIWSGRDPYIERLVSAAQDEYLEKYGREMSEEEINIFIGSFKSLSDLQLKNISQNH